MANRSNDEMDILGSDDGDASAAPTDTSPAPEPEESEAEPATPQMSVKPADDGGYEVTFKIAPAAAEEAPAEAALPAEEPGAGEPS